MGAGVLWVLTLFCLSHGLHGLMDLTEASFKPSLQSLPENQIVLMELYASWCPACRLFAPEFEKIAAYFETPPYTTPKVVVARADCATEVALCGRFKIDGYPSLKLGYPADFIEDAKHANLKAFPTGNTRTKSTVVSWVGQQLDTVFKFETRTPAAVSSGSASAIGSATKQPQQFSIADTEVATKELFSEATLSLRGSDTRTALNTLVSVFAVAHPSLNCMEGAKTLIASYDTLWPPSDEEPTSELLQFPICGQQAASKWVACDDKGTNTRGFTCGLWNLLHSLSTHHPSDQSGEAIMGAVSAFVTHFFKCTMCAGHFKTLLDREDAKAVKSKRDAALWLWKMHNIVNARLAAEAAAEAAAGTGTDASGAAGAKAPAKIQWPSAKQCPSCRLPALETDEKNVKWSEAEVYGFLLRFYGGPGSGSQAVPQTTAVGTGTSKVATAGSTTQPEVQAQVTQVGLGGRKDLYERHATAAQFTRTTFVFLVLLLGVWYTAAKVFHKHRHVSRRPFGYDR